MLSWQSKIRSAKNATLFVIVLTAANTHAQIRYNADVKYLIDSMAREDQHWRVLFTELRNGKADSTKFSRDFVSGQIRMTDSLNYYLCRKIFDKYGYADHLLVGELSSNNCWLLIQHQDRRVEFQEEVLPALKAAADSGLASKTQVAYLTDRVLVNRGKKQRYGTQCRLNRKKNSFEPMPVKHPWRLNKRRFQMGMGPIEEYIRIMNDHYEGAIRSSAN